MRTLKLFVSIALFCIVVILLIFGTGLFDLAYQRYFGVRKENVRREVFEESRSYNQAKVQELAKYKLEYERATNKVEKQALEGVIRHKFADYNDDRLPIELQMFLEKIRGY